MNNTMKSMMNELNRAWAEATRGLVQVKNIIDAEDMDEMKEYLREFGYKYFTAKNAYKNIEDINSDGDNALPIKKTAYGYRAVVITIERR